MTTTFSDDALHILVVLDDDKPRYGPGPSSNYWPAGLWDELAGLVDARRMEAPFDDDRPLGTSDGERIRAGDVDALIDHEFRLTDAGRAAMNAAFDARAGVTSHQAGAEPGDSR